jgi:hypothetical protein
MNEIFRLNSFSMDGANAGESFPTRHPHTESEVLLSFTYGTQSKTT